MDRVLQEVGDDGGGGWPDDELAPDPDPAPELGGVAGVGAETGAAEYAVVVVLVVAAVSVLVLVLRVRADVCGAFSSGGYGLQARRVVDVVDKASNERAMLGKKSKYQNRKLIAIIKINSTILICGQARKAYPYSGCFCSLIPVFYHDLLCSQKERQSLLYKQ